MRHCRQRCADAQIVQDAAIMDQLQFDPSRQLLGAQCSGALMLAKLNLLRGVPACTDLTSKPWSKKRSGSAESVVLRRGKCRHCGGCLASQYLAAWVIARLVGVEEAGKAIHYVAPVGRSSCT